MISFDEFNEWFARSLLIPIGWQKHELSTARIVGASIKASAKECYNDYLESIPEDDPELIAQAEAFINERKKQNG